MDELALELGISPVEIRKINMLRHNDKTITGQVMLESRGLGLEECLDKTVERLDFSDVRETERPIKKGKGIAAFMYGTGVATRAEGASVFVCLQLDGTVNVQTASTVGSRSVVMVGNAIIDACNQLKKDLFEVAATKLFPTAGLANLVIENDLIFERGKPEDAIPFATLVATTFNSQRPLAAKGSWFPPPATFSEENGQGNTLHAYTFGVHGIELEVDTETGVIEITKSILACDVGRAINPDNVRGQMEGGAAQAIAWALMEESVMDKGILKNSTFHNYIIPSIMDLPPLESIIVEHPNELGPFGAKGAGEAPIIGGAPAIRNALRDALGFPINVIPLTSKNVLMAIKKHNQAEGK